MKIVLNCFCIPLGRLWCVGWRDNRELGHEARFATYEDAIEFVRGLRRRMRYDR